MTQATAPTAITSLRFVSLRDLTIDHALWTNPRTITGLDDTAIGELAADIKARGIQVPLIVQKIKSTSGGVTNLVLEGQRRVLAANEVLAKDADIPVVDRSADAIVLTPETADELMLDMLAVAAKREGLSSVELSEVAERLRNRGRKLSDIAKAIGKNEGWISKILKARTQATPKLMLRWRKGQVTDEQFKDLAEVKDKESQEEKTEQVVKVRQSGDKTEARTLSKEIKEEERRAKAAPAKAPAPKPEVAVKGPQEDLFEKGAKPVAPKPPKKPTTARLALEDMLGLAARRAPTHDYVKGIMDGVAYALGEKYPDEWGKAWRVYLARVEGSGKPVKGKKAKSKKTAKAKARKPAKKAAKKRGK